MATSFRPDTQLQGITDLTLFATLRSGFVVSAETISYVERLRRVLKTLNALRLGSRENTDPPSPFTDVVSRFRIVHSFRWAIIENEGQPAQLLLNVCFDGGWEPYMRVIWRDLGSMLDLILCHAEDYPLSCENSFETYMRWVRAHERSSDFLYLESGLSSSDHDYLAELERELRVEQPKDPQLAATRLRRNGPGAVKPLPQGPAALPMVVAGLTPLAALYGLDRFFKPGEFDGECLRRAARDILFELVALDTARLIPMPHPLRLAHGRMLQWFETAPRPAPVKPRALAYDPAQVQGGILRGYEQLTCGALVLLRIAKRADAAAWLSRHPFTSEAQTGLPADGLYRNLALSLAGLKALGLPQTRIDRMPQAFREGMDARAGALGDLRHNHPRWWKLPRRNWPEADGAQAVAMSSVHVLIQLRSVAERRPADWAPHIAALEAGSGLQVLSVQWMRRNAPGGVTTENFGFVDGISQPSAEPGTGTQFSDQVPRGDLLLGYPTSFDRHAVPEEADALLDKGTFLVVRKLRQHVGRLRAQVDGEAKRLRIRREVLMAKMMGRTPAGVPLADESLGAGNDFNYGRDLQASACPFHAHVRRANPREGAPLPRLLRRGMSYGPKFDPKKPDDDADRGLFFMAYNANLSEQFETVQRWLAGGNASGGYSGQGDPFMGVAVKGEPRVFRFEHEGKAVALNLGDQPFVELQWGGYFFVPSLTALRNLPALVEPVVLPPATPVPTRTPPAGDARAWQQWFEDSSTRDTAWAWVRAQPGGVVRSPYGVLVGDPARVCDVFRDVQQRYSVGGYGKRMHHSVGRGFLGMDEDGAHQGHKEQAPRVNAAIEKISEAEAFAAAHAAAGKWLATLRAGAQALNAAGLPDPLREFPVDLERLSETVLAGLCRLWFGLPDGKLMWDENQPPAPVGTPEPPRCPRGFFAVSRYVFGPNPSPAAEKSGQDKGRALLDAVTRWLATAPADMPPLSREIVAAMKDIEAVDHGATARTLTGVMLGFPPTVHGNLVQTLAAWGIKQMLWDLQLDYTGAAQVDRYANAVATLRPTLLGTMLRQPVPFAVWRTARSAHRFGEVDVDEGDKLIVGIMSATAANPGEHFTMFGGDRQDAVRPAPLHACSGYPMAMGTMLGVIAALMEAGTIRATPSPTVVNVDL